MVKRVRGLSRVPLLFAVSGELGRALRLPRAKVAAVMLIYELLLLSEVMAAE